MIPECCNHAAEKQFQSLYPDTGNRLRERGFVNYLHSIAKRWGEMTQTVMDEFSVKTVDEEGFINARIYPVTCEKGHEKSLVVISMRLYFFIWRLNMLMASYWNMDNKGVLIPKENSDSWPDTNVLAELSNMILMYFGVEDITDADFEKFNDIVFGSHKVAGTMYAMVVDLSELFILFHEFQHVVPILPPNLSVRFAPLPEQMVPKEKSEDWMEELHADANSLKFLYLAAFQHYSTIYKLDVLDAKKTAAGIVFSGADAALHALVILEQINFGDTTLQLETIDKTTRKHPPAILRRNIFGEYSKSLALQSVGEIHWDKIRESVASMGFVRDRLFKEFFMKRPDVISEVRNLW